MAKRPADYADTLDKEIWQFIDDTLADLPENSAQLSLAGQRAHYDKHCQRFMQPRPTGVASQDAFIEQSSHQIPIRTYQPGNTTPPAHIIYYHGGGFVVGNLNTHDDVCAELCAQTGFSLTAVDYRLAPEHPYPAAFDDAFAVFQYFAENQDLPLIVVGDSAGGNLAAAVSHLSREHMKQPVGQVLIYPVLGFDLDTPSYHKHVEAPLLSRADMQFYFEAYIGDGNQQQAITEAPLNDKDFTSLPVTAIITADCDPLRDDGRLYYEKLKAAGGDVSWVNEEGLVHGYLRARHRAQKAKDSFRRIVEAIKQFGQS